MSTHDAPAEPVGPPNRLASEKSPYLLQHAHNPVDWHAFNSETLAKAKREDRPIFLSIGYATCHWCHVMERESFEDPDVAAVINGLFLCIKVDREERPDVDQIYMQSVMALHGQGGWPLSVWLTPDLKPFYGGTYFPKEPRWGRPGFVDICRTLADLFKKRRADVEAQAAQAVALLSHRPAKAAGVRSDLGTLAADGVAKLLAEFDPKHGGFGEAPKFPRPCTLDLLAHAIARKDDPAVREAIVVTLDRMRRGGMYDHVGGGFARYSTDDRWLVPHFEKMLYDNAQLIEAYLDGAALAARPDFTETAEDVGRWVAARMTHPDGGIASAEDADSEGEEGRFYVFTPEELRDAVGPDADRVMRVFGATPLGNFEGSNVLHLPLPFDEAAAAEGLDGAALAAWWTPVRERFRVWRDRRIPPLLDDKVLASWNGLMIAALARLGAFTGDRRYTERAIRAADFCRAKLWSAESGTLLRRYRDGDARYPGSLDDYAAMALGSVAIFQATGDASRLAFALTLQRRAEELFADTAGGGFFFAAAGADLVARMKEAYDGAIPSANALMARLYAKLGAILGDEAMRRKARETVEAFADEVGRAPHAYPSLASAVMEADEPPRQLYVCADAADADFVALLRRAHRDPMPGRVIIPVLATERAGLVALGMELDGKGPRAGKPAAYLCENLSCRDF